MKTVKLLCTTIGEKFRHNVVTIHVHFWPPSTHSVIPFTTTRGSDWIDCKNMRRADEGRHEEMRGTFSSSFKHLLQIWWLHYLPPSSVLSLSVSPFASVPPPGIEEVDLLYGGKRDRKINKIYFSYAVRNSRVITPLISIHTYIHNNILFIISTLQLCRLQL